MGDKYGPNTRQVERFLQRVAALSASKWERKSMVVDGLLKSDSPRGIWELTDEGWPETKRIATAATNPNYRA